MSVACKEEEGIVNFNFTCNRKKQKYLIEILLKYSHLDLKELGASLQISTTFLLAVLEGRYYLDKEKGITLAELFLLFFGE
ncbi:hypothetical protein [Legionella bozemanae]|uniref:HTH cro/C1-type domain-containing protein n=1 Tax=Legionella bozemanae TaxID=447 RepID=A0A0W0RY66_LEGBO|nr:hypothetical protein [Legionella bozemanae]KTC75876.1 hypothetical protein Lboz_0704 [Legionella bozemanae]STO35501.1 Uncharacterised protein [Legionella bozemanae]